MADPTEFANIFEGLLAPGAEAGAATGTRVLGSNALTDALVPASTFGPVTAGVSTRYRAFQPPPLIPPAPQEYQSSVPDPTDANAAIQGLTDEVSHTYQNLLDPAEQDRLAKYMQSIYSVPPPGDPIQWPNYAQNTQEKLAAARDLAGAPHDRMVALTGEDHSDYFLSPNEIPEITTAKFGEARWARGVIEEAQRVGLDVDQEIAMLPPEQGAGRIAALAQKVQQIDPGAAVGPPDAVMTVAAELRRGAPPVNEPTPPQELPLLSMQDIVNNPAGVAPRPEAFQQNEAIASIQQQQIASAASSGQPFHAGDLHPDLPAEHPLLSSGAVPPAVPVHVDEEGRQMVQVEGPNGEPALVEISRGMVPAAIPALLNGQPIRWSFRPNRTAPVRFTLDRNTERLVLDPDATQALKPLQEAWHKSQLDAHQNGITDPMEDPVMALEAITTNALPTSTEASNSVAVAEALRDKHTQKGIDIVNLAARLAGPDASLREIARETARIIAEYHGMGSIVEAANAIAHSRLEEVQLREAQERADLFGHAPYARPKRSAIALTMRRKIYSGPVSPYFAGQWSTLRRMSNITTTTAAEILASHDEIEWKDPASEEAVLQRIVDYGKAEIQAQLKSRNSGADWYRKSIKDMKRNVKVLFPDMTPEEMSAFLMILAISSNGHTPSANFALAAFAHEQYLATGTYPEVGPHAGKGWGGIKAGTIGIHMMRLQGLVDLHEGDLKAVAKFLKQEMPLGSRSEPAEGSLREMEMKLRAAGKWSGDLDADESTLNLGSADETVFGSMLFGPKLGAFFLNMNGISHVLTIDAWKGRTFHRWMGDHPVKEDNQGNLVPDDSISLRQRRLLQAGYERLVAAMRPRLGADFDVMDAQAIMWYYEKRLFAHAGARPSGQESFADASRKYLDAYEKRAFPERFLFAPGVGPTFREGGIAYDGGAGGPNSGAGERRELESCPVCGFLEDISERPPCPVCDGTGMVVRVDRRRNMRFGEAALTLENAEIIRLARSYMSHVPWTYDENPWEVAHANKALGEKCAFVHEMVPHIPFDSDVQAAYAAMKQETLAQYLFLESQGYKMEPWLGEGQPYADSAAARADVRDNRHLYFFTGGDIPAGHPLAEDIPEGDSHAMKRAFHLALQHAAGAPLTTADMILTYNDIFRAVHDIFGHAKLGNQFGPKGEVIAYAEHSRMFSPQALPAVAAETFMQNSWVNFGPQAEGLTPSERPYAEQKAYIVPQELLTEIRQTYSRFYPKGSPVDPTKLPTPLLALAAKVVEAVRQNGGGTFHLLKPEMQPFNAQVGYGVGSEPTEKRFRVIPKEFFSPDHVIEMILANLDVLGNDNIFVGSWVDKDGLVWLEPSETVVDRELAIDLGKRRNQIAVWDAGGGVEIPTGGTGLPTGSTLRELVTLPEQREQNFQVKRQLALLGPLQMEHVAGLGVDVDAIQFTRNGSVDITGVRVKSPLDLVRALMPQRNPTFETTRYIFVDTDEGKVLHQIALTSRAPSSSPLKPEEMMLPAWMGELGQTLRRLRDETGHAVKLVLAHNHPSGKTTPSTSDLQVIDKLKEGLPQDSIWYGLITDHDTFHLIPQAGPPEQGNIPENVGQSDPLIRTVIPNPATLKQIWTGTDVENLAITPGQVVEDAALADYVTMLYRDNSAKVRLIEHLPAEKFLDSSAVQGWVRDQARAVGATDVFSYHPDPASLGIDPKPLVLNGVLRDFVSAGGESAADALSENERRGAAIMREMAALNDEAIRLHEPSPDPQEQATLRATALANSAAGRGWSGKRGKEMFAALTDTERFQAMLARIQDGQLANERHLASLDPRRWVATPPSYFGAWKPSPAETAALIAAWDERSKTWRVAAATQQRIEQNARRRGLAQRAGKPGAVVVPEIKLEDLTTIQTSDLDKWARDEPAKYDEWVRQFFRVADPMTEEVARLPQSQQRVALMAKLDSIKSALADLEEGKIYQGPHPSGDPKDPYNALTVGILNTRNSMRSVSTLFRTMARPYTVLGPARQGDHPLDIQDDMASGIAQRSIYQDLFQGDLKRHQGVMKAFQDFDLLFKAASRSEDLDRKIARGLDIGIWRAPSELQKPEWRVAPVQVGTKKHEMDLSTELPKLAAFYENIISQAEKAVLYRTASESARYRADAKFLEQEIRRRELAEAMRLGWAGTQSWAGTQWQTGMEWQDIHPDTVAIAKERLRKANATTDDHTVSYVNGLPTFLGQMPYHTLVAMKSAATSQLQKRLDLTEAIQNGSLRRENYRTRVHRMTADWIRSVLRDPYSSFGQYATPKVRNHFLDPVRSEKEPYQSWAVGWPLYVPAMMRTIHLEPGLLKATKRATSLPVDQQEYALDWIRHLKGIDVPSDVQMNRMVMEGTAHETHALDAVVKRAFGTDLAGLSKAAQAAGQLDTRPWSRTLRHMGSWAMFALVGVPKVAILHASEVAYLLHELSKKPFPDVPLGTLWAGAGMLKGGRDGMREFASFIKNNISGAPRWYAEPSYMGVVDSAHAMLHEMHEEALPSGEKLYRRAIQSVPEAWAFAMRASTYWVRATTYYTTKARALHYGMDEDLAQTVAAQQTNHMIGAYSKRDLSPVSRGSFWNPWWRFKRFGWAKTEQIASDLIGTTQGIGHLAGKAFGGRTDGLPRLDMGNGGGDQIPPIDPPDVPGFEFNEFPDEERQAWEDSNTPAAEYGAAFPCGPRGSMRLAMQLLFGLGGSLTGVYYLATLMHLDDFSHNIWHEVTPTKMVENMAEIPILFALKDTSRYVELSAKGFIVGLTTKEAQEKEQRAQRLEFTIPFIGQALRSRFFHQKEQDAVAKANAKRLGFKPFGLPKLRGIGEPAGSRRLDGSTTQPGFLMKLINSMRGQPSLPQSPEPMPSAAPAPGDAQAPGDAPLAPQAPQATIPPPPG